MISPHSLKKYFFAIFWLILLLFFSYIHTYPYDVLSQLHFETLHSELVPSYWVFNWHLTHLIRGEFDQLFSGNLFYPLNDSVLFNENLLSSAILAAPLFWLTGDSYLCYEILIFISFILCFLGMYLLSRQLNFDAVPSILAAFIFSFSEYRIGTYIYGHFATMQWMPFTLLYIHKYFDEKKCFNLYVAAIFYALQTTASAHYFVLFSLFLLVFIAILGFQNNALASRWFYKDAALPFVLAMSFTILNYFPFYEVSQNYNFERSIATQAYYGLPISSFFNATGSYFFKSFGEWTGGSIGGNYPLRFISLLLTFASLIILRVNVSRFPGIRKLDISLIVLCVITIILFYFKTFISDITLSSFPFLHDNPTVITTAIISPLLLALTLRLSLTNFIRGLYEGLKTQKIFFLYFMLALFCFIVSLGPVIKTYEQNYFMANPLGIFLYFTFPGFPGIRAISRMGGLIPIGAAICAAFSFTLIKNKFNLNIYKVIFSCSVLILLLVETFPSKGIHSPYKPENNKKNIPELYKWLKKIPDKGAVFEWPSECFSCDVHYTKWSTYHQKPILNGWASFQWDGHKKLNGMVNLSKPKNLLSLYAFGPKYIFVHKKDSDFPSWANDSFGKFNLIKKFKNTLVYENKSAQTQFLPDKYWMKFAVSHHLIDKEKIKISLTFFSPDKFYVSVNKILLPIQIIWENGFVKSEEMTIYPTLWRNNDVFSLEIKPNLSKIKNIIVGFPIDYSVKSPISN